MHLERAELLIEQNRWDMAEEQLRQHLGNEPDDGHAMALLALCLSEQKRLPEALDLAEQAVGLAPDLPFAHYALALVHFERGKYGPAAAAAEEAAALSPDSPDLHALRAAIHLGRKRWQACLAAAEEALALDAEHVWANNLRAQALVHLGRKDEAGLTIELALEQDPENATSHANMGWTLLHRGEHRKALHHFREALRLDPQDEWARQGIIQALQSHHLLYRWMLKYFLWMSRFGSKAQWAIILGLFFGYRFLVKATDGTPALQLAIIVLYLGFAYMTWTANALFNVVLRLHPFGKHVLSEEERAASTLNAGCLLVAALSLAYGLWTGDTYWMLVGLGTALLVMPISISVGVENPAKRSIGKAVAGGFALFGALAVGLRFVSPELSGGLGVLYFLGIVAFSWLGGFLR